MIRLEPLNMSHLDGVMTWINDPAVTFYFAKMGEVITREAEARYLRHLIDSSQDRIYSIFAGSDYVGQIGVSKIYGPAGNGRVGLMLRREAWGRGIAKNAAALLFEKAFGPEMGLHKLWLILRKDNMKGRHLWESLGFQLEGRLRQEYWVQDKYHDMLRFGLLSSDSPVWQKYLPRTTT